MAPAHEEVHTGESLVTARTSTESAVLGGRFHLWPHLAYLSTPTGAIVNIL